MPAEPLLTAAGQQLSGPLLITPKVFGDDRGLFFESWNESRFRSDLIEAGMPAGEAEAIQFRQDNHSRSSRGVLRGLHFQLPLKPQGNCPLQCGHDLDVAVDLRRDPTATASGLALS